MTRIAAVRSAFPPNRYPQAELTDAQAGLSHLDAGQRALQQRLHQNSGVRTRHLALPIDQYGSLREFGAANDRYLEVATELGAAAITSALQASGRTAPDVDLLMVTSVTGVAVPSLDALLIPRLGLRTDIRRVPIFGLGCVAGAAGLARLHDYLLGRPDHTAVLLAIELCSLTWPRGDATTADLVACGLFGDGSAAVVATGDRDRSGPHVVDSRSEVIPASSGALGWRLASNGFRIVLTTELAVAIERNLRPLVLHFLGAHHLTSHDIARWVCHPGGPKVLDVVESCLGLPRPALALSRRSLAEAGNLSSVSVLHILEQTLAAEAPPPDSFGLMIGLGPGVSVELVLLRW
ncbi:type III polyketide synthase [Cryptosporangium sp. NPDC051539]|uniref:type III polyketide synthase n=1 Tax=Cryptosporangium sp. NPDC051539 TaxID=3363962 RepID=UPI0037AD0E61